MAAKSVGATIPAYLIEAGDRIAVTYKNGARFAGKACGRTQAHRFGWYITINRLAGGTDRCESSDIATIQYLG